MSTLENIVNWLNAIVDRLFSPQKRSCKNCKWYDIIWKHGQTFAFDLSNKHFKKMKERRERDGFTGQCKPWMGMRGNNAPRCNNYRRKRLLLWRAK